MRLSALSFVAIVLIVAGCGEASKPAVSPELLSARQSLRLSEAPETATTLTDLAESWAPERLEQQVVLTGRVYADDQVPWEAEQASFLLSVLPEKGHDDPEHADNCPFCKRKASLAPKAIVRFTDPSGNVLPFGAQQLFELTKGDVVTVRGTIESFDLNVFIIRADGMYK